MLNDVQSREYTRGKALAKFFADNAALIATYLPLAAQVADFNTNVAAFDALVPVKDTDSTGVTLDKSMLRQKVADLGGTICLKAHAYALETGNESLAAKTDMSTKGFMRLKDADVKAFALNIEGLVTPLLADAAFTPYLVTATNLADLVAAATAFDGHIGIARVAENNGRVANKDINGIIGKIRANIGRCDLLVSHFQESNPDFVLGYQANSAINNIGVRHTRIGGLVTVKATGAPVAGAVVKIAGTGLQAVSDAEGHYAIPGVPVGDITVSCTANGFAPAEVPFHTRRGHHDELDIQV